MIVEININNLSEFPLDEIDNSFLSNPIIIQKALFRIKMWFKSNNGNLIGEIKGNIEEFKNSGINYVENPNPTAEYNMQYLNNEWEVLADENELYKTHSRKLIEYNLGDIFDLMADVSKRLGMLERVVLRDINERYNNNLIPVELKNDYKNLANNYVLAIDGGFAKDRADLEDSEELYNRLINRFTLITNILQTNYFNKKV